jgi:hypothetical protein
MKAISWAIVAEFQSNRKLRIEIPRTFAIVIQIWRLPLSSYVFNPKMRAGRIFGILNPKTEPGRKFSDLEIRKRCRLNVSEFEVFDFQKSENTRTG